MTCSVRASAIFLVVAAWLSPARGAETPSRVVIDANFPGAYQGEVADVNGDKKPDIIAVGGGTCAWYENPTWKKRLVSGPKDTPGVISSATADLDGDGRAEVAIAYEFEMNAPSKGKLLLAKQANDGTEAWTYQQIGDIGSIHRLRWGELDGEKGPELVIAPLFGPKAAPPGYQQQPATILRYLPLARPAGEKAAFDEVKPRFVLHAIELIDVNGDGQDDILTADNEGVCMLSAELRGAGLPWRMIPLAPGAPGNAPKRGCSEVHLGRAMGRRYLATVEPWHGTEVAVYPEQRPRSLQFGPRVVIDDTLADGHALWVADVDGDGDDEIFAGHRGKDHRVSMYDFNRAAKSWTKTVIDRDIAAQDLRGGDLDGDGTPDVVAVGGQTHNVVMYRFTR